MLDVHQAALVTARLRRKLTHAWSPFFARFGRLTEIQLQAIPAVLTGTNVVVAAPTASGKTEAVVAPVAERHRSEGWSGLGVVYVVPTRALANDLFARLQGPLEDMYLKCVVKHGDTPGLPDGGFDWLITTPESLDSLICRRPAAFNSLRTVILDEIHLVDGTYRGDQIRVLLSRLTRLSKAVPLNVHLLSATLHAPAVVAGRYISDAKVIEVGNSRHIAWRLLTSHAEVIELAKQQRWRKLLYFCNTRQHVESTSGELQALWAPYPVVAHHGSLERAERVEAEEVMKQSRVAACVATSTLEIGIDIGDIDLVVLVDPPWSLDSLQQRIGRGSRRADVIQAAALYRTEDERDAVQSMFEAVAKGAYQQVDYGPDRSVIVQQALSILYQHRTGVDPSYIAELVQVLGNTFEVELILDYLVEKGYCVSRWGKLFPSDDLLDLGDEGKIHSNIPDQTDYLVRDADSGQPIGRIRGSFDNTFLLGGKSWRLVAMQGGEVVVQRCSSAAAPAAFGMRRNVGQWYYLLPRDLRY